MNTNHRPTTGNYPSSKTALPRSRTGVLNEEKPKTQSGKNKIKTPLTRPASLEMTHYQTGVRLGKSRDIVTP